MSDWNMETPQVKGLYNDMTPEEAQHTGQANTLIENNLSSVEIEHNSKGTKWTIKVKHEDAYKALATSQEIDKQLREIYNEK
jgi:hypothetical protein